MLQAKIDVSSQLQKGQSNPAGCASVQRLTGMTPPCPPRGLSVPGSGGQDENPGFPLRRASLSPSL